MLCARGASKEKKKKRKRQMVVVGFDHVQFPITLCSGFPAKGTGGDHAPPPRKMLFWRL